MLFYPGALSLYVIYNYFNHKFIFLDAHIIIYKHLHAYMMTGLVIDGFSIWVMFWVIWQLIAGDVGTHDPHVDWLHPISDLGSQTDFSCHPIDICPQWALILVDDWVRIGRLWFVHVLDVVIYLTFNMPFLTSGENVKTNLVVLEVCCTVIWRQQHIIY